MNIINYKKPFYHTIIEDFYTDSEQELIWQEIDFLNQPNKLMTPSHTGDAGAASLNKLGIFLDDLYLNFRQFSNILTLNQKIFHLSEHFKDNPFAKYLDICNKDLTMLSYYGNNSFYNIHHDDFVISAITTFWKTPKQFTGGNLTFDEYDYIPKMNHNTMILFPSFELHSVSKINMIDDGISGRYTINQFFTFRSS
jgi:hypothetical protein